MFRRLLVGAYKIFPIVYRCGAIFGWVHSYTGSVNYCYCSTLYQELFVSTRIYVVGVEETGMIIGFGGVICYHPFRSQLFFFFKDRNDEDCNKNSSEIKTTFSQECRYRFRCTDRKSSRTKHSHSKRTQFP